jgi:hypothetical protein
MRHLHVFLQACFVLSAGAIGAACSATGGGNTFTNSTGSGGGTNTDPTIITGGSGSGGDGILTSTPPCNPSDPNVDMDGDGYTPAQGDCNDCTAQMNPGAIDWPGNGVDEDCNGVADDTPANCDGSLALDSGDPLDGARAIGLCKRSVNGSWGLVSARYGIADNSPLAGYDAEGIGHGILTDFGPNVKPREGKKLLALSSGAARRPSDPGYYPPGNGQGFDLTALDTGLDKSYSGSPPPGFPTPSPACPNANPGQAYDSVSLEVTVKVPTNVKALSYNLDFYTSEYPDFICDDYNDFFVALLSPPPPQHADGNISFDAQGNMISVNAGFLQVCKANPSAGKSGKAFTCPLGTSQLKGTGFDVTASGQNIGNGAATGWLETTAPVTPGSTIKLRFVIWDSTDANLDSTVLVDNFGWGTAGGATVTQPVQ